MKNDSLTKDVLAGLAGGLLASWAMSKLMEPGAQRMKERLPRAEFERRMMTSPEGRSPTAKTAAVIAEKVARAPLTERQIETADPIVHYAFGAFLGVLYALASRRSSVLRWGRGLGFGTAVWYGSDEVALPLLNLSKRPARSPPSTHGFALIAHWLYGSVLDATLRVVRRIL